MLGMTASDAEELRRILLEVIKTDEVQLGRRNGYGQHYTLDFTLERLLNTHCRVGMGRCDKPTSWLRLPLLMLPQFWGRGL